MQSSTSRQPIDTGGWSAFGSVWGSDDGRNAAGHLLLRGNGLRAWNGWPTDERPGNQRPSWIDTADQAGQREIAGQVQVQVLEDGPFPPV